MAHVTIFPFSLLIGCANYGFNSIDQIKYYVNPYWGFVRIITYLV